MRRTLACLLATICIGALVLWVVMQRPEENPAAPEIAETPLIAENLEENTFTEEIAVSLPPIVASEEATDPILNAFSIAAQEHLEESLEWESRIWGYVTDEQGDPIPEATVGVIDTVRGRDALVRIVQTDFEGRYELIDAHRDISMMRHGVITLVAHSPGHSREQGWIRDLTSAVPVAQLDFELGSELFLSGHVIWQDGEPVCNAPMILTISTRSENSDFALSTGQTDDRGHFRIGGLHEGDVSVAVAPWGGVYQSGGHHFQAGDENVTVILIPPTGVVRGQVTGALTEDPQADVEVWLGDQANGERVWATMTDDQGMFRFDGIPLEPWAVRIPIWHETETAILSEDSPEAEVSLSIPEPVHVAGIVVEHETERPIPNLGLMVWGRASNQSLETTTDSEGRFELADLPVKPHQPLEFRPHFVSLDPHWIVRHTGGYLTLSNARRIELRAWRALPLEVTAVDPDGQPLAHADLEIFTPGSRGINFGVTDSSGVYRGTRLPEMLERCAIVGSHPDWPLLLSPEILESDASAVVTALPLLDLHVTVVNPEGNPVEGASLSQGQLIDLWEEESQSRRSWVGDYGMHNARTDEAGQAIFRAVPRFLSVVHASLRVERELLAEAEETIDLTTADDPAHLTITLASMEEVTITGHVFDWNDQPIADATVSHDSESSFPGRDLPRAVTDSNGFFRIVSRESWLRSGLVASAEGYAEEESRVRDGVADFHLDPTITLMGQIRRPDGDPASPQRLITWRPIRGHWSGAWMQWTGIPGDRVTREDGRFEWGIDVHRYGSESLDALPFPAWITAWTSSGEVATADFECMGEAGRIVDLGELTLRPGFTLNGRALSSAGGPIPNAVAIWEYNPLLSSRSRQEEIGARWAAITDEEGLFSLGPLPTGMWRFGITAEEHQPLALEIDVQSDITRDFVLTHDEGSALTITLLDPNGAPIPRAQSSVSDQTGSSHQVGYTNAGGVKTFDGLIQGSHRLNLQFEWDTLNIRHGREIEIGPLDETLLVNMANWPIVSGTVTREGEPVADVQCVLREVGPSELNSCRGPTAADGTYRLFMPPGDHILYCEGENSAISLTEDTVLNLELEPED